GASSRRSVTDVGEHLSRHRDLGHLTRDIAPVSRTALVMVITRSQSAPLDIAELVEHEHRVIAGPAHMPVACTALFLAIGRVLSQESLSSTIVFGGRQCTLLIHRLGRSARATGFSGRLTHLVSNRLI